MAIIRSVPRKRRMPSIRNAVMVDTVRGVLRVRKWPKKRGKPKSELQRWWNDWFRQANLLAKYADAATHRQAIIMTAKSGWYPRDVILSAMRGRLYTWVDQDGWKWYPVAAIQDISDSLDVLAQTVGSVLVRATDRWRAPVAGTSGDVLTYQGAAAPPTWETPAAPGASLGCLSVSSVNQNVAAATLVPLVWDTESYDDAGIHDPATNPSRFTMPAGATRVQFVGQVAWAASASGTFRQVIVTKNGSPAVYNGRPHTTVYDLNGVANVHQQVVGGALPVVPGDYFELACLHDGAGTLVVNAANSSFSCIINP